MSIIAKVHLIEQWERLEDEQRERIEGQAREKWEQEIEPDAYDLYIEDAENDWVDVALGQQDRYVYEALEAWDATEDARRAEFMKAASE